jgi:uncharacterized integral membrane protein
MVDEQPETIPDSAEPVRRPFPVGILLVFLLLLAFGIFLAQNGTATSVQFLKFEFDSTLAMVSLIAFVAGLLAGLILAMVIGRRRRRRA